MGFEYRFAHGDQPLAAAGRPSKPPPGPRQAERAPQALRMWRCRRSTCAGQPRCSAWTPSPWAGVLSQSAAGESGRQSVLRWLPWATLAWRAGASGIPRRQRCEGLARHTPALGRRPRRPPRGRVPCGRSRPDAS